MKKLTLAPILLTLALSSLSATNSNLALEIDPATYGFDGYSVHLKKSFETLPHLQFGLGIYAMDFPDLFVDLNSKNKNKDWDVRLDRGIGFFADYYFDVEQKGFFTGIQVAKQRYEIERNGQKSSYDTTLIMGSFGYLYQPYDNGFYIKPWMGIGYQDKSSGSNVVNGVEYDVASVLPFATVHLGYKF